MSSPDPLLPLIQPGTRLDRFEILGLIARGGMAEVWLARLAGPHGVERLYAVKTMLPQLVKEPALHKLLIDEARIASRIDHPNVARLHELGEFFGEPFVVIDWIDGDPMSDVLDLLGESSRMPAGVACRIIADACAGLHAAHELRDADGELLGVVHRDISPSNILVDRHGNAKIIDFGIAHARDRLAERTATGVVRGKLSYMSREQAQGEAVDRRSDVWAMGAVLYHLLCSRHPFEGRTPLENVRRVLDGVPAAPLPETLPAGIRAVTARALAHELDLRFESAAAMRQALISAMETSGLQSSTDEVAGYLATLLEKRRAERSELVASALNAARARAATAVHAGEPSSAAPEPAATLLAPKEPTPPRGEVPSRPGQQSEPAALAAQPTRLPRILAAGAIAAAVSVVIWLAATRGHQPEALQGASEVSSPPVASAVPPDAMTPSGEVLPVPSSSSQPRSSAVRGAARPPATRPSSSSWMRDYGF